REDHGKENLPRPDWNGMMRKLSRLLGAPDGADQRVEHVIHHHAPARDIPDPRMNFLRDVSKRGTGTWIRAGHAPIADASEEHGHHGNDNGRDDVTVAAIAKPPEGRH